MKASVQIPKRHVTRVSKAVFRRSSWLQLHALKRPFTNISNIEYVPCNYKRLFIFRPYNYISPYFLKFYMYMKLFLFWICMKYLPLDVNQTKTNLRVAFLLWTYWGENLSSTGLQCLYMNNHDIVLLRWKTFIILDAGIFYQSSSVSAFIIAMICYPSDSWLTVFFVLKII